MYSSSAIDPARKQLIRELTNSYLPSCVKRRSTSGRQNCVFGEATLSSVTAVTMALKLPAHQLSDAPHSDIAGITFNSSSSFFSTSTSQGWVIYRTEPLAIISRRGEGELSSSQTTLYSRSNPLQSSPTRPCDSSSRSPKRTSYSSSAVPLLRSTRRTRSSSGTTSSARRWRSSSSART